MGATQWSIWANEHALTSCGFIAIGSLVPIITLLLGTDKFQHPITKFVAQDYLGNDSIHYIAPVFTLVLCFLIATLEWPRNQIKSNGRTEKRIFHDKLYTCVWKHLGVVTRNFYFRAIIHCFLSVPSVIFLPTSIGGISLTISSLIYILAARNGETFKTVIAVEKTRPRPGNIDIEDISLPVPVQDENNDYGLYENLRSPFKRKSKSIRKTLSNVLSRKPKKSPTPNQGPPTPPSKPNQGPATPNSKPNHGPPMPPSKPNQGPATPNSKPNHGPPTPPSKPNQGPATPPSKPNTGPSNPYSKPNKGPATPPLKPKSEPNTTPSKPNKGPATPPSKPNRQWAEPDEKITQEKEERGKKRQPKKEDPESDGRTKPTTPKPTSRPLLPPSTTQNATSDKLGKEGRGRGKTEDGETRGHKPHEYEPPWDNNSAQLQKQLNFV